jgi:hypothetical protein
VVLVLLAASRRLGPLDEAEVAGAAFDFLGKVPPLRVDRTRE